MRSLLLGKTALQVSRIALGTAAFGLPDYGIREPGEAGAPSESDAIRVIQAANERGINFFDTARGYGESEAILGKALKGRSNCVIATKVSVPRRVNNENATLSIRAVTESIETSLRCLQRETIDIVQIHNATSGDLREGGILEVLSLARKQGKLRFVGASVYGEDAALGAIRSGKIDVLQIAINLLDQRMMTTVLPEARKTDVGVIARSALLKGALTDRVKMLPAELRPLADAAERAREILGETWESLPRAALRFCLSVPGAHSVLVGLRKISELSGSLEAEENGPLSDAMMKEASLLKLSDENLLNPSHWPSVNQTPEKVEI